MDQIDFRTCTQEEALEVLRPVVERLAKEIVMPTAQKTNPSRKGCVFAFCRKDPGASTLSLVCRFEIGENPLDRVEKRRRLVEEKAFRLSRHPDHISSAQSADEKREMFPGAIRCGEGEELYFSCSGFLGLEDDMLCALTAWRLDLITMDFIERLIKAGNNKPLADHMASDISL